MERNKQAEEFSSPPSPADEDVPMLDADPSTSGDEAADESATMPTRRVPVTERRPADSQNDAYSQSPSYRPRRTEEVSEGRDTSPPIYEDIASTATVNLPHPQEPTELFMELDQLGRHTPFAKQVEHVFYDSWTDRNKSPHVEGIFLFDIKSAPPRLEGRQQPTLVSSSQDTVLLSSLIELPLSFHGARRACYLGDPGYPLNFCHSNKCSTCMVFRNQYGLRVARMGFTLGPKIFASPSSSQADVFVTNHHIRSSQHAMVLCACPSIAQSNSQPTTPGTPPPYSATTSNCEVVVPIGLIMYTRRGWHPS
ncbi:hypothetical protein BJX64DRAFT_270745 [Aspergillus heterothallicus]